MKMAASRATDAAFVALMAAFIVGLLAITSDTYFVGDDWGLLHQGLEVRGLVEPYNDHLSVTILTLYRLLAEVFGLTYAPFRMAGALCLVAVPALYYVTNRRILGPGVAAIAALLLLTVPRTELQTATFNHYLVLVGAIVCAAAMNSDRHVWVAVGLVLALSAAGGGVAVAVACLVHSALTRAPFRRWLAVAVPFGLWAVWWVTKAESSQFRPQVQPNAADTLRYARNVIVSPFDSPVGVILAVLAVIATVQAFRHRMADAANLAAWGAAVVVWGVGLAWSRGDQGTVAMYGRYELLALGFVLLALVPRRPLPPVPAPWAWGLVALIVVGAVGQWSAMRATLEGKAALMAAFGAIAQCSVVEGEAALPLLTAEQTAEVVQRYGRGDASCEP